MRKYVTMCQRVGKDPLASPHGGFLCPRCVLRAMAELIEDDDDQPADDRGEEPKR